MKRRAETKTQNRSLESQRAVLEAVVGLISEKGISNCSTANISDRAGASWGVLQYQFGSKRDIFEALLQSGVDELEKAIMRLLQDTPDKSTLLTKLLDVIWSYYSSPVYRASMEILFNYSHEEKGFTDIATRARAVLKKAFKKVFDKMELEVSSTVAATQIDLVMACLRGLAVGNALVPGGSSSYKAHRVMLESMILNTLSE